MCNKCTIEEECVCLKEAMVNVKSTDGLSFIKEFLRSQRETRKNLSR